MQQVARILRTDAEVAVHGGFVEGSGVALVEFEDGLVPEGTTSEDCGAVVNMGVEDHHEPRAILASPEELRGSARSVEQPMAKRVAERSRSKMQLDRRFGG